MLDAPFVHHVFFFPAGDELAMIAVSYCCVTVRENRGPGGNNPVPFFTGHENHQSHRGNHAEAGGVNRNPGPLHDINDGKSRGTGSARRINNHLHLADIALDVMFDDFLAYGLGARRVNIAG